MKKLLILVTILFLNFDAPQVFAQEKPQEFIVVKMIIKKEVFEHQLRIPIEKSFKDAPLTGGLFASTCCSNCLLSSSYGFYGFAVRVNQDETRIRISGTFENQKSCRFDAKNFVVSRNKINKSKLKCGIEMVAFYENKPTSD